MRNHLLLALAVAALCGCGRDTTTAPQPPAPVVANPAGLKTLDTLVGVVHQMTADSIDTIQYTLTTADGSSFYLAGPNLSDAANLEGTKVIVAGKLDDATFWVESIALVIDAPDPCTMDLAPGDPIPVQCIGGVTRVKPRKP